MFPETDRRTVQGIQGVRQDRTHGQQAHQQQYRMVLPL